MAKISLENVDKVYPNGYVAARDLSLEAADGELLVLVGPSGSGKSTVLRLMAGLERVSEGVIRIGDRDVTDLPLSNLDAQLRVETRVELARLHRKLGATMVYVTHDQSEALTLGDRIAVLKEGVLQQVATPMELYQRPANKFVAGFIGSPAMNFIEGVIQRAEGAAGQMGVCTFKGIDI